MKSYFIFGLLIIISFDFCFSQVTSDNLHKNYTENIGNVKIDMVFIQGGLYKKRKVENFTKTNNFTEFIIKDYYIGRYEITQEQWFAVIGKCKNQEKTDLASPVNNVSWNEAKEFLNKLNKITGKKYRLPSEAEWEYAASCRTEIGTYTWAGTNKLDSITKYGYLGENNDFTSTKPKHIGSYLPNCLGLYDMLGNVAEFCQDTCATNNPNLPEDLKLSL